MTENDAPNDRSSWNSINDSTAMWTKWCASWSLWTTWNVLENWNVRDQTQIALRSRWGGAQHFSEASGSDWATVCCRALVAQIQPSSLRSQTLEEGDGDVHVTLRPCDMVPATVIVNVSWDFEWTLTLCGLGTFALDGPVWVSSYIIPSNPLSVSILCQISYSASVTLMLTQDDIWLLDSIHHEYLKMDVTYHIHQSYYLSFSFIFLLSWVPSRPVTYLLLYFDALIVYLLSWSTTYSIIFSFFLLCACLSLYSLAWSLTYVTVFWITCFFYSILAQSLTLLRVYLLTYTANVTSTYVRDHLLKLTKY